MKWPYAYRKEEQKGNFHLWVLGTCLKDRHEWMILSRKGGHRH